VVRPEREPLAQAVQIDEARGKRGAKSMVLVATESDGRVRLAHADKNDEATVKCFAD
jgi:hypothetical protein